MTMDLRTKTLKKILRKHIKYRLRNVPNLLADNLLETDYLNLKPKESICLDYRIKLEAVSDLGEYRQVNLSVEQLAGVPDTQPTVSELIRETLLDAIREHKDKGG